MPSRDRRGSQIAVVLPPELLQRLKAYAEAHHRPMASLIREWVEQGLGTTPAAPVAPTASAAPAMGALEVRVAVLEAQVAELRRRPALSPLPTPERLEPLEPRVAPPAPEASAAPLPPGRLSAEQAAGLRTNRELCSAFGLKAESAVTNWISRNGHEKAIGKVWRGYRLRGKALLPNAQTPCWLWQKA